MTTSSRVWIIFAVGGARISHRGHHWFPRHYRRQSPDYPQTWLLPACHQILLVGSTLVACSGASDSSCPLALLVSNSTVTSWELLASLTPYSSPLQNIFWSNSITEMSSWKSEGGQRWGEVSLSPVCPVFNLHLSRKVSLRKQGLLSKKIVN